MAFNPFHKFRKHQKVIFACLTIFCMFSFVACSGMVGGGDLAHWLQSTILRRTAPDKVGELYGSAVTQRDLVTLIRQREIANMYMAGVTELVLQKRMQELRPPGADQRMTAELLQKMFSDREVIELQQRLNRQPYFGGNLKTEGLFDFLIWLHQADRLGIKLSTADIQKEVNRLTNGRLSADRRDSGTIEKVLRDRFRETFSGEVLLTALGNEFRVQMAQAAILGLEPSTLGRMPDPITPEEFWDYFKENQTRLDIRLLPVKVEDYLAQVKEQPQEKDLKDLYQKYKDKEYSPDSKEPGFKLPRRVQIEWLSGKADSPYYKKAAADLRTLIQATQQVGFGAANLPGAPGIAPALEQSITAGVDTLLVAEYNRSTRNEWAPYLAPSYTRPWWQPAAFSFHEPNVNQADNIVAAIGAGAGPLSPVAVVAGLMGNASYHEIADRAQRGSTWLLAGMQPTPLTAWLSTGAVGADLTPASEFLPISQFKDQLTQRVLKFLAQDLLATNLKNLTKDIESRAKQTDKEKQELSEIIAKAVKQYDLRTGKTTESRDQFKNKIADDPGMLPLKDAYTAPPSRDPEAKRFADLFLGQNSKGVFVVERFPQSPFRPPEDDSEWRSAPESFIFWKTSDQPAKTAPFEDPEVKKEVERAWRMQKARDLAKKEAESLAVKAREDKGDVRKLRDTAVKNKTELVELPSISKRVQAPSFRPEVAFTYESPRISEEKVPHAGPEFATKLLTLQQKEKGDTTVVSDFPEAVYYVAVLVDKKPPTMDEFFTVYRDGAADAVRRNPLLQMLEKEKKDKYESEVLALLRQEAKMKIDEKAKGKDNASTED